MTNQAFRFIHTSDLHLEMPVNGLTECPGHLEERILDAPFASARRLFKYAIGEKIDFIVLSGDILAPSVVGPIGMVFMLEELEKLNKAGIQVYWAGGKAECQDDIPRAFTFPPNVHIFPCGRVQEYIFEKDGVATTRLVGTSIGKQSITLHPTELSSEDENLYTVAVFYGKLPPEALRGGTVEYWALGGEHRREFVSRSPSIVHYPGATLARNPMETGDYGATLVEVNEFGQAKCTQLKTSTLVWATEKLTAHDGMTEEQILTDMRARIRPLREGLGDTMLMLSWRLDISGELAQEIRYGSLANSLLRDVRTDFGKEDPVVFSIDLKPILPEINSDDIYEQQTILGDYLRMLHYYRENPNEKIDMTSFLPPDYRDYLETQRYYRQRRQEYAMQDRADAAHGENLRLPEQDTKAFRAEIPVVLRLLDCADEEGDAGKEPETKSTPEELAFRAKRQERRIEVLREAAALGIELLSGDEPGQGRKTTGQRQNPTLTQERRDFARFKDGKESLS